MKTLHALLFLLAALALAPSGSAQPIVNGDMNGVANYAVFNAVTPPGWTGVGFGGSKCRKAIRSTRGSW